MMSVLRCVQIEPGEGENQVDFVAVLDQVITLLRQRGRLTSRKAFFLPVVSSRSGNAYNPSDRRARCWARRSPNGSPKAKYEKRPRN